MGIVVTVFMLVALLMAAPWSALRLGRLNKNPLRVGQLTTGIVLAGLWNTLWFGLRHLGYFWGIAALVSGIFMVLVAILVRVDHGTPLGASSTFLMPIYKVVKRLMWPLWGALLACFLLYSVTLVRLNLGLPILGS